MLHVVVYMQRVLRALWGTAPAHPAVWTDGREQTSLDAERDRWFVLR